MKKIILAVTLVAITSLTGCKKNAESINQTMYECVPHQRADFVNDRLVREVSIDDGDMSRLIITGTSSNMNLEIYDTALDVTREFTNSKFLNNEKQSLLYKINFTYAGKSWKQQMILPVDAYQKYKFFYQRSTHTLSSTDGQTELAVVLGGWCTRVSDV